MEARKPSHNIPEQVSIEHNFDTKTSVAVWTFESAARQYTKEDGEVPAVAKTYVRGTFEWADLPDLIKMDLVISAMKIMPMVRRPIHEHLAEDASVREFKFVMNDETMTKKVTRKAGGDKTPTAENMLEAVKSGKIDKAALLALLATLE